MSETNDAEIDDRIGVISQDFLNLPVYVHPYRFGFSGAWCHRVNAFLMPMDDAVGCVNFLNRHISGRSKIMGVDRAEVEGDESGWFVVSVWGKDGLIGYS